MTTLTIEYCVPCGLLDTALDVQEALLEEYGQDLDAATLKTGHGGVFKVHVDDELVWDKDEHGGEIDLERISDAVEQRVSASA